VNGQQPDSRAVALNIVGKKFHALKKVIRFLDVLLRRDGI